MKHQATTTEAALSAGPVALFGLLCARLSESVGYGLLTLLAPEASGARLVRPYSSRPDEFPPGEADPVEGTRWFRALFVEKQPVVANDEEAIRAWLPDYDDPAAAVYASLLNFPIVVGGEVIGLINMMAGRGHFDDARIEATRLQAPLAALVLLTHFSKLPTVSIPEGSA
jgi:GAF domain-containing protein